MWCALLMAVADNAGIGLAMNMVTMARNYPLISLEVTEKAADQLYEHQQIQQNGQQQQQGQQVVVQQQQIQQQAPNPALAPSPHQPQHQQPPSQPQSQANQLQKQVSSGQVQAIEVARANGVNGAIRGENEGDDEATTLDAHSNGSNDSMRELEDLLTKLNPLAKEFVPPSHADASSTAPSAASSKGQPRKVCSPRCFASFHRVKRWPRCFAIPYLRLFPIRRWPICRLRMPSSLAIRGAS